MKLHYRKIGQGKPLIILHGLFGSADNWNSLAKEFSRTFEVYIVDQRNHGLSPHSTEFNYEVMSNDLLELLDDNNIEKASIIGHSMGGKVLMQFAALNANRIENMIVVDISPRYYKPHHQNVLKALQSIDFNSIETRKQAEEILTPQLNEVSTTQFLLKNIYWKDASGNEGKKLAWRFNLDSIINNIEMIGVESPQVNSALSGKMKVLFISGEKSDYITDDDKRLIRTYYPTAIVKTIENAGHWVQAEQPRVFYETVLNFILK